MLHCFNAIILTNWIHLILTFTLTFCLKISLYTFLANIEEAESTEESAEDITAAETAPRPKNATALEENYEI